jgi:hypothetical protein
MIFWVRGLRELRIVNRQWRLAQCRRSELGQVLAGSESLGSGGCRQWYGCRWR